jgi:pterin-4a-carbinolamine dehydratase
MANVGKTEQITGQQFLSSEGVEDWRPIFGGGWASAYFRTGSFEAGVALIERIGALAAAADHYPDVDMRPEGVTVRLFSGTWDQLGQRDVELAQQISGAACGVQLRRLSRSSRVYPARERLTIDSGRLLVGPDAGAIAEKARKHGFRRSGRVRR